MQQGKWVVKLNGIDFAEIFTVLIGDKTSRRDTNSYAEIYAVGETPRVMVSMSKGAEIIEIEGEYLPFKKLRPVQLADGSYDVVCIDPGVVASGTMKRAA